MSKKRSPVFEENWQLIGWYTDGWWLKKGRQFFSRKNRVCRPSWRAPHFFLNRALLRVNPALPVVVVSGQSSAEYCGDRPFSALYIKTASLNTMRLRNGSQWSCLKTGVMCSRRRVPVTKRAAAFCTAWRRRGAADCQRCRTAASYSSQDAKRWMHQPPSSRLWPIALVWIYYTHRPTMWQKSDRLIAIARLNIIPVLYIYCMVFGVWLTLA